MGSTRFDWLDAVASERGPTAPTTRHVLHVLFRFMDSDGACFPSIRQISAASALTERSVCTHLERAEAEGWVTRSSAGRSGQAWKRGRYQATIPEALKDVQHLRSEPLKEIQHLTRKALKDVQHLRTERRSAPRAEGTEPLSEGTEPNDKKALKEVQSNLTENTPENLKPTIGGNESRSGRRKRSVQLPASWSPTESHRALATELGVDVDLEREKFEDYHVSRGNAFVDWDRAFNNWLRKAREFRGSRGCSDQRQEADARQHWEIERDDPGVDSAHDRALLRFR